MTNQSVELVSDRTALSLPDGLLIDEWENLGRRLSSHEQKVQWWIGDWWAYGDRSYGSRAQLVAQNVFGRSYGGLRNLGSVARNIAPSRRRDDVSFRHHTEVAYLPEEVGDAILAKACENKWTVDLVRQEVKRVKVTMGEGPAEELPKAYEPRKFQRLADMMRAAFSDWFGVGDVYASVLMALFEASGSTIAPRDLAVAVDSHRPMSTGALHEAISSLRKTMEAEAIDRNDEGYCLSEVGMKECRTAIRQEASALAAFGLEAANDWGSGRAV